MTDMSISLAPLTGRQLAVLFAGRLAINTAFRLVYPLLAFLAAGLAVDLRVASLLITVQVAATLLSPLGGRLADIYGDLWHGLQALDRGDGVYAVSYWRESYFQHWGHHASSAIYAIDEFYRKTKNGEQDGAANPSSPGG